MATTLQSLPSRASVLSQKIAELGIPLHSATFEGRPSLTAYDKG